MMASPSTTPPVGVDGQAAVGVAVVGQAEVGAVDTTACCNAPGGLTRSRR